MLLREFDERLGWNHGFLSCAHWLHWRTSIDLGASREKVRVARALATLPRISWAMEHGQLSYAKVWALTRVATSENEAALLDVALCATAADVERFVRGWRRADRASEAHEDARSSPTGDPLSEEVTPEQRRADALALLAEAALSADLDRGSTGDRYQVVRHVDASADRASIVVPRSADGSLDSGGALELDHGAQRVSAETSRRLSCDAAVVTIRHDDDGFDNSASRHTRTIPAAVRRALAARDRTCRFPGCTSRRCDAHHIEHWADGGATRLDNLVLLCRRHHRAVHEGGFDVTAGESGTLEFWQPNGARLRQTPSACDEPHEVSTMDPPAPWDGTRFDLAYALDVLWRPPADGSAHSPQR